MTREALLNSWEERRKYMNNEANRYEVAAQEALLRGDSFEETVYRRFRDGCLEKAEELTIRINRLKERVS